MIVLFWILVVGTVVSTDINTMSTNYGAPVDDARNSLTVGNRGPHLLQDTYFVEQLQTHNRERIPERNVHARGSTAKGTFTPTNMEMVSEYTTAAFLNTDQPTEMALRFSTVIHSKGSPEYLRDPRGFAIKLYTQEGNYDIVGLNFPVFFIRDALRFPEMIRSLKPNPKTGVQEWWRIWDYFSHYPESTHMFSWLMDDVGIPKNYRQMDGWGIHTYKWISRTGNNTLVRYYFKSEQGVESFASDDAATKIMFSNHTADLYQNIAQKNYPRWKWFVQMIDANDKAFIDMLDFDILDTTKEWPAVLVPMMEVGVIELNTNVDSQFLENEMIAFSPGRFVPGIEASDEKMLQGRIFAYSDTQRYRLGTNNQMLPINRPKCPFRDPSIDGSMNIQDPKDMLTNSAQEVNYFPSEFSTVQEASPMHHDNEKVTGSKVRQGITKTNDFEQAGNRYRSWNGARQDRFAQRVGVALADPGLDVKPSVRTTWMNYWKQADPDMAANIQHFLDQHVAIYKGRFIGEKHWEMKKFGEDFHRASGSQPRNF